jgi:riboflavin transporter FmnP
MFTPYLSLDLKDLIIVIAGFSFGSLSAAAVSLIVSLIEFLTVSTTGFWGLLMNVISSCAFAVTASIIYRKKPCFTNAVIGLILGTLLTTALMLLWNLIVTPIYTGMPAEAIVAMLVPVFLPFNLVKYGINAAAAAVLFTPLMRIMKSSQLSD